MKTVIFIFLVTIFGCKSAKTDTTKNNNANELVNKALADSISIDSLASQPACIKDLIAKMKAAAVTNPPSKIFSYSYEGKKVYYVPAVCCDNFSDLYNDSCIIIAHPDGGFTGRGDGKIKDFEEKRSNEKLIWEDKRKN
jgi:hypothetical protein